MTERRRLTKTEERVYEAWQRLGSPTLVAHELGVGVSFVYRCRRAIEAKLGVSLDVTNDQSSRAAARHLMRLKAHEGRIDLTVENGTVIVFSDAHYFPGIVSTAHRALLHFIKELRPRAIICAGDAFDGSTISRHPRIGWDKKPSVLEELNAVKERLGEVETAAKAAKCKTLIWALGNHDARYETFLAAAAPQYEGVGGFHLKDHFPVWAPCWATWINGHTAVKHRWHQGVHATYNNALKSGVNIVTGHLHSLKVTPWSDYTGRRYGVDAGTLADPYGPQFIDYTEANSVNWASGFAVLTFREGRLLLPELVQVFDEGRVEFRGEILKV